MIRLMADLVITTSLRATYSESRSPCRQTWAASITRSSMKRPPARRASKAGKSSSTVRAVRKPRPPRLTPRFGAQPGRLLLQERLQAALLAPREQPLYDAAGLGSVGLGDDADALHAGS